MVVWTQKFLDFGGEGWWEPTMVISKRFSPSLCRAIITSRKLSPKKPQLKSGAVLLTSVICSRCMIANFLLHFATIILNNFGTCNIPSEDLSNYILHAPKFLKFQSLNQKTTSVAIQWLQNMLVKRNCSQFQLQFIWAEFSTSESMEKNWVE
jgi:hypothetical protein